MSTFRLHMHRWVCTMRIVCLHTDILLIVFVLKPTDPTWMMLKFSRICLAMTTSLHANFKFKQHWEMECSYLGLDYSASGVGSTRQVVLGIGIWVLFSLFFRLSFWRGRAGFKPFLQVQNYNKNTIARYALWERNLASLWSEGICERNIDWDCVSSTSVFLIRTAPRVIFR